MTRVFGILTPLLLLLLTGPAWGGEQGDALDDDAFWEEEGEFQNEFMNGTGTGGGPSMTRYPVDLSDVNAVLEDAGLLALPEQDLYWGGAGWWGISTGDGIFVAIGGGGYGGSEEVKNNMQLARWSHGAGYIAMKGIYPLHRRLFVEAGVQLGAGVSSVWVEDSDADSGLIHVHLRGDRTFLLLRPQIGVDLRLARWAGILVEGGYALTSGEWQLEGESALLDEIEFSDESQPYFTVMLRFGI